MKDEHPLQVGMLCYPRLTQLDLTGPYEVLSRMPNTEVHILWKNEAPVKTERGLCTVPTLTLHQSPRLGVIVVPGGLGQQDLMEDDESRFAPARFCLRRLDCFAGIARLVIGCFCRCLNPWARFPQMSAW